MKLRSYLSCAGLGIGLLCSHATTPAQTTLPDGVLRDPTPAHFNVCFNHGCQDLADVRFTPEHWQEIRRLFDPPPASPAAERGRIAEAIGALERLTGRLTGLDNDRGGSLSGLWMRNQMDCIDESTNTRTYLTLLHQDGLLHYHRPSATERRFWPFLYQHYTATVLERDTGRVYAVDSWFYDNGLPAVVLPLKIWKRGWRRGDPAPLEDGD